MKSSLNDFGLAVLRISASALMITHGYGKFTMLASGDEIQFPEVLGMSSTLSLSLAVLGEFITPILILIGFRTKWAAIPTTLVMAVAAFIIHGSDPFVKKEMALIYFFVFFSITFLGGGKYSLDAMMRRRR